MGKKSVFTTKTFGLVVITAILVVVIQLLSPSFLKAGNLRQLFMTLSFEGVMLAGIAILLLSGNFDMSAGGVGALSMLIFGLCIQNFHLNWVLSIFIGLAAGVVCGLFNVFLMNVLNMMPFIATIATSSIFAGIGNVATRGNSIPINSPDFTNIGKIALFDVVPLLFVVMVVIVLIHTFVLYKTRFGRGVYMIGGNMFAARLCGLNIKRTRAILYTSQGLMSAIAALMWSCYRKQANPAAFTLAVPHMQAMIAAMLGGVSMMGGAGGIGGAAIGLVILKVFNSGLLALDVPTYVVVALPGVLLAVALFMDNLNAMRMRRVLMAAAIKQAVPKQEKEKVNS